jgi:hypothetical protein
LNQTGVAAEKTFEQAERAHFNAPEPLCAVLRIRL